MLEITTSMIVILIVVDCEPPELLAQIVNMAPAVIWVGVPHIVPLLVSNVSPVGKLALISQVETLPVVAFVVMVGVTGEIVTPLVAEMSL